MRFPGGRRAEPGNLPATKDSDSHHDSKVDSRKDSATISSPAAPSKPLPTRTASTRIQEPARNHSQVNRTISRKSASGQTHEKPERPGLQRRRTTVQTRYVDMLLELDTISKLDNIGASIFTWVLLAGYIVFPATFNNIQDDENLDRAANSELEKHALETVRNLPLLYIAAFSCGVGVLGCLGLWFKHRNNYVWVINRVFLPALMNSIAGLISTLVNVYSARDGQYSVTAKATLIVTAALSVASAALFLLANNIMLALVKRRHDKETKELERGLTGGEAYVDKQKEKRKAARSEKGGLHAVGADPGRIV